MGDIPSVTPSSHDNAKTQPKPSENDFDKCLPLLERIKAMEQEARALRESNNELNEEIEKLGKDARECQERILECDRMEKEFLAEEKADWEDIKHVVAAMAVTVMAQDYVDQHPGTTGLRNNRHLPQ